MFKIEKKDGLFFLLAAAVFALGAWVGQQTQPLVDETLHYPRILQILHPQIQLPHQGAMLPGYHLTMAALSAVTGVESGQGMRFFSALLSFFAVAAFFVLARRVDGDSAFRKSGQFLFFPLLFPFFFLLYTDVYSLAWIYLMLAAALGRRMVWAGVFCLLAVVVRQNNIFWGLLVCLMLYAERYYPRRDARALAAFAREIWAFLFCGILFAVYLVLNKGPVHSEQGANPVYPNPGNIAVCLFLFFFLFLPMNIVNFPRIADLLKKDRRPLWAVLAFFVFYACRFEPNHFYNHPKIFSYFLHNRLLEFMTRSFAVKIACFLPMAYAILSLWVTPLKRPGMNLLYPVAFLFLLPILMVEPRYYLIPCTLFMAFRREEPAAVFYPTLVFYVLASGLLFSGIMRAQFFL